MPCSSRYHPPITAPACPAPCLEALREDAARDQVRSLVAEFESLTDPRGAGGVRYRVSSLLARVVCAMTPAGHDSITATAEWCRRAAPEELAAFGLPWKEIPVIHRDDARGHGRHEQRLVQVVTVDGPLFPHARQVLRIQRKRRPYGAKKWSSETVYAVTDLPAEQADAAGTAAWARGHWTVENTVHWVRDVIFGEVKTQIRTRNTPVVPAAVRDLIRSALELAGYVNTAAGRRAHTGRQRVLALYGIT